MKINKLLIIGVFTFCLVSCKNEPKTEVNANQPKNQTKEKDKQLNITILLDLSDRIEPTKYPSSPEHFERDIEVVNYFTELFKKDMEKKGAFMAKGKMKVIFSPRPNDSEINEIATQLSIDLSKTKNTKEKKNIFDNVSINFKENLSKIYSKTIETKKYPGSDIWRFFKNDVVDYCIEDSSDYRNILVLITDGYLYHKNSTDKTKNRTASLLPINIASSGLRSPNWKDKFDSQDFGYITTRSDLNNLDVLVLEINPSEKFKNDEDVIKEYLSKWFTEMNVNSFKLYNSDLPQYTKSKIDKFINQ
ncbi:MAG: hypothetical protein PSN34_12020 [Urechidicola sp.]|nr:hypothetical protein [Urechidicola sp.]